MQKKVKYFAFFDCLYSRSVSNTPRNAEHEQEILKSKIFLLMSVNRQNGGTL